jgi:FkbM family methyltransferase
MLTITQWMRGPINLGPLGFLLFELEGLRSRLAQNRQPLVYRTKCAQFSLRARPQTTDRSIFWQIFGDREYRCLDDVKDAGLIIDCGANVGYSSAYFLTRFPNSHVVAVEPDSNNFDLLKSNLTPYGGRCRVVKSAIWSKPVGLVLDEATLSGPECSRKVREARAEEKPLVIATDIRHLLKESGFDRISILKIDIEGSELELFSSNYHEWLPLVDRLVIELHHDECAAAFHNAIKSQPHVLSQCDELVVYKRV